MIHVFFVEDHVMLIFTKLHIARLLLCVTQHLDDCCAADRDGMECVF